MRSVIIALLILFLILTGINNVFAQNEKGKFSDIPIKDRLFLGGNFGLQFGNRYTLIEVSPLVGLWLSPKFVAGGGPVYRYYKRTDLNFDFEENQYGGRLFGRYLLIQNLFAHAEYELLNLTDYRIQPNSPRTNISSFLVGGGYIQNLGRSAVFIMVLFNLNETELTPYTNPVIRAGFNIGL